MTTLREAAQQALEALVAAYQGKDKTGQVTAAITALRAALAEPDLNHCPQCGGPADNGHDRSFPPNPYWCSKCMAEPAKDQSA